MRTTATTTKRRGVASDRKNVNVEKIRSKLASYDEDKVRRYFDKLDKDQSGCVSSKELTKLVRKIVKEDATQQDTDDLLREMDKNKDSTVSVEELLAFAFQVSPSKSELNSSPPGSSSKEALDGKDASGEREQELAAIKIQARIREDLPGVCEARKIAEWKIRRRGRRGQSS